MSLLDKWDAGDVPDGLDKEEWNLLRAVAVSGPAVAERQGAPQAGEVVEIRVNACAYSCCGRGWRRRDDYEQVYAGYVDNLTDATFMLYSMGIGTVSYVVAVHFSELLGVNRS